MRRSVLGVLASCFALGAEAWAVPGPESVAIIANVNAPESLALAERYRSARNIPRRQVCALDLPLDDTIDLNIYQDQFVAPLATCLDSAGVAARIEALVLVRGLPLRVTITTPDGDRRVSLAAAAGLGDSAFTATGSAILGAPPGRTISCGNASCYAAAFTNPFLDDPGVFEAGWTKTVAGRTWRPKLVTMLNGRSYAEAAQLIASATTAESTGGASGEFLFMNGADPARGVLDSTYDAAIAGLESMGSTAARVDFDPDLEGRRLAAFFVGSASLGNTIEGNELLAGALVDNLTSFGAVPVNFTTSGEQQVSIARFVARGAAGVHGTTDEPLNNVFPDRALIVDYAEGGTLAEAFHRHLPYVYWRNLVLGDPIAAPYARRPEVHIEGLVDGERIDARSLRVRATDPLDRPIDRLTLFLDGVELAQVTADELSLCLVPPEGAGELLAVAQVSDDGSPGARHRPKGWTRIEVVGIAGQTDCAPTADGGLSDAGFDDANTDAEGGPDAGPADRGETSDANLPDAETGDDGSIVPPEEETGCACSDSGRASSSTSFWAIALLGLIRRRSVRSAGGDSRSSALRDSSRRRRPTSG